MATTAPVCDTSLTKAIRAAFAQAGQNRLEKSVLSKCKYNALKGAVDTHFCPYIQLIILRVYRRRVGHDVAYFS